MTAPANPANPLVAERQDSTTAISGIGIAESAVDLYNGISSGSWSEIAIGGAGAALETVGLVIDPVGTLVSAGISWLIEHIKPLTDALDWLAGDPDTIASYAQTWRNVSGAVAGAQQSFTGAVSQQTGQWTGTAGDAYRASATRQADQLSATATASDTIGSVVEIVGVLVGVVREIVRDLVADCIATLVARVPQWLAEAGLTLGLATPHIVASAVTLISRWVRRIADVIQKLVRSINNLRPLLRRLDEVWEAIRTGLRRAPGGPDAPSPSTPDAPSPDPVRTPDTDAPAVDPDPSSTTTPQGTTTPGSPTAPPQTGGTDIPTTTSPTGTTPTTTTPTTSPSTGTGTPTSPTSPTRPTRPTSPTSQANPASPASPTPPTTSTAPPTTPTTPDPPGVRRSNTAGIQHYDASGGTIPTHRIQHPDAGLVDPNDIARAQLDPNRASVVNNPGAPATDPRVQGLTQNWDQWGNAGDQTSWESRYVTGTDPNTGRRDFSWPDPQQHPQGFATPESRVPAVLEPGTVIDRFGNADGRFLSPAGVPFEARGLPPDNLADGYHQYRVVREIPVWMGPAAPAMGQPGGGLQYLSPYQVADLVQAGYLEEIT